VFAPISSMNTSWATSTKKSYDLQKKYEYPKAPSIYSRVTPPRTCLRDYKLTLNQTTAM
jgi:hypothetical protein